MTAAVLENLALLCEAHGGVDRLRSLIVELAVSGRLVPQQPEDEHGADLAVRLTAAKTQAVAAGGRRAKALERPAAHVWPFEIPASWTWQVLDDLLWITGGVTLGRKLAGRAVVALPYLRVANVQRGFITLDDLKDIEVPADEADKYLLQPGDLLITEGGDWDKVGRTAIWQGKIERCLHQNHVFRARATSAEFLPRWAELYLNSPEARRYFAGSSKQTTNLASINMTQLRSCAFPLPPLAEQRRIVAKVDELMALCDRLEARQQDAEAAHARLVQALLDSLTQARDAEEFQACWERVAGQFDSLFTTETAIDALKIVVCRVGVAGRLMQPTDDVGDVAKLVAALVDHWRKRSSRRAALAEVSEADQRYPLPSSWIWLSFGFVAETRLGKMLDAAKNTGTPKPYLRNTNVQWDRFVLDDLKELRLEETELDEYAVKAGDLLICEGGEPGRCAVWRDAARELYFQKALHRARPLGGVSADYLKICLQVDAATGVLSQLFTGATIKHLTGEKLERYAVPVPPPEEQHRIVAKVTELLALCDQLKARIAAARAKHAQLAEALVAQAVAG